jgi:hypothetical protein
MIFGRSLRGALVIMVAMMFSSPVASMFVPDKLSKPDPVQAAADQNCANAAASLVTGVRDGHFAEYVAGCNKSPDKDTCRSTQQFIADSGIKVPPELNCK